VDTVTDPIKLREETKEFIDKIRALRINKEKETFKEACKKLGIHETELKIKHFYTCNSI